MLNLNSLLVSSENPDALSDFYEKILQKKPDMDESGFKGFLVGSAFLGIGPHDKVTGHNPNPERIIINFEAADVKNEFERIKNLGAKVIAEPYQMGEDMPGWIATFEDPDGNYFQLVTPWEGEM